MRLGRTTAAAVVGMAVLAGCSDGDTANETLPPTSFASAPTTETLQPLGPADFPVPPAARKSDLAGASAFVDYYLNLMSRAQVSLATDGLRELSSTCDACIAFADGVDDYRRKGYRVSGGGIEVVGASVPALINGRAEFSVSVTQQAIDVLDANGERLDEFSATKAAYPASGAAAIWSPAQSSWLMAELTIQ
jgi:hypothetical protein